MSLSNRRAWLKNISSYCALTLGIVVASAFSVTSSANVQAQVKGNGASAHEIVASPGAKAIDDANAKKGIKPPKFTGPITTEAAQLGSNGSWDAKLMQTTLGVDPVSLIPNALGLNSGAPKGFKFTPYSTIKNLPTIAEKRFGIPETVCGADSRIRVTPTTSAPWRMNCYLIITLSDGSQAVGSGWMAGPRCVITAGHCVHDGGAGGAFVSNIQVIPGSDANKRPYGSYYSSRFYTVRGWTNDASPEYDYAAIILSSDVGSRVGTYGYANYSNSTLNNMLVNTAGYPGDKPSGTQWRTAGNIQTISERQLFYMFDTFGGQSGSAVYRNVGSSRIAVGVHAYGGCPNGATRINGFVHSNITSWKGLK